MTTTSGLPATTTTAPATSLHSGSTSATKATQGYNSELFLKLLTTQLANQDPSSPMDSAQMVSQTAQLASMEQLTTLNKTVTSSNGSQMQATATSMLGKNVTWTDSDGNAQSGVVSSISFKDATSPSLTVGGRTVALSDVSGVTATAATASSS